MATIEQPRSLLDDVLQETLPDTSVLEELDARLDSPTIAFEPVKISQPADRTPSDDGPKAIKLLATEIIALDERDRRTQERRQRKLERRANRPFNLLATSMIMAGTVVTMGSPHPVKVHHDTVSEAAKHPMAGVSKEQKQAAEQKMQAMMAKIVAPTCAERFNSEAPATQAQIVWKNAAGSYKAPMCTDPATNFYSFRVEQPQTKSTYNFQIDVDAAHLATEATLIKGSDELGDSGVESLIIERSDAGYSMHGIPRIWSEQKGLEDSYFAYSTTDETGNKPDEEDKGTFPTEAQLQKASDWLDQSLAAAAVPIPVIKGPIIKAPKGRRR